MIGEGSVFVVYSLTTVLEVVGVTWLGPASWHVQHMAYGLEARGK